jgi:hypothetical protein
MKKTKVLLAGALVLALGLVMGCKGLGSGNEDAQKEDKYTWVWAGQKSGDVYPDKENNTTNYERFFEQFGSTNYTLESGIVHINMKYPQFGKAGVVFGLNEAATKDSEDKNNVNFYVFGIGQKKGGTQLEYYVDYYQAISRTALSTASASETVANGVTPIWSYEVDSTDMFLVESFPGFVADNPEDIYVQITYNEDDGNYSIKAGPGERALTSINLELPSHATITRATEATGRVGVYGMLTKKDGATTPKVNTTYKLLRDGLETTGTFLAAEEE